MRFFSVLVTFLLAAPMSVLAQSVAEDQLPAGFLQTVNPHMGRSKTANAGGGVLGTRSNASVLGIDTLPNWSSYFYYPGVDSNGFPQFTWQYTMVGNSPFARNDKWGDDDDWQGATTKIGAPIIPVNIDLRNADGSPRFVGGQRLYMDATQYVAPVLKSPAFAKTYYTSSEDPTQFTDAVQRAEFYHKSSDDWHTLLKPRVGTPRTMVLLRGTYSFALNKDGTCCAYVLINQNTFGNALFPAAPDDTTTPIGAAEHSGDFKTTDLGIFLFNNAYLYDTTPSNCCVLGFHSYDLEPGSAANGWREKHYVMSYASWVSPGLFGAGFSDITALSHELAETFNDPFVNNATPWWLAPNGLCQNNLETGDVIEGLSNATYPIPLNGYTYHPQK